MWEERAIRSQAAYDPSWIPAIEAEGSRFEASPARILIADDQPDVVAALRLLLKGEGFQVEAASSPAEVRTAVDSLALDLLLIDLNFARDTTSGEEGLELLKWIQARDGTLPVVVLTGWPTIDLAVESLRTGAGDFIPKPWDNAKLLAVLRAQVARGRARRERRRRERDAVQEMEEARQIQHALIPRRIPEIPGFPIAAHWRPAGHLSGDYFDVLPLGEHHFAVCIADAVGKGLPAALLMSSVQAMVRSLGEGGLSPRRLCEKLNASFCGSIAPNKFISLFYGVLDTREGIFRYANAGHNPPILIHRDGSSQRLAEGGGVLGVGEHWSYEEAEVTLQSGDRILLFTDGVSEARNPDGEEFGEGRVIELMLENRALDPTPLQAVLMNRVMEFSNGHLEDDATLVAMAVA